jgi:hypothetical protein
MGHQITQYSATYGGEQSEEQHTAKSEVRMGRSVGTDVGEYDESYCVKRGHYVP